MNIRRYIPYIVCIGFAFLAGAIGSFFTFQNIPLWYNHLVHPFWTPPNWVFGPAWSLLYILMGISAALVWKSQTKGKVLALSIFFFHLIVNSAWSIIFFGLQDPLTALLVIKSLWLLIVALMIVNWRYSRTATLLLIPYLLWVTYAASLNLGIILLNP